MECDLNGKGLFLLGNIVQSLGKAICITQVKIPMPLSRLGYHSSQNANASNFNPGHQLVFKLF